MVCSACSSENRQGRKYCAQCGAALDQECPSCGTTNLPTERFCGQCGTPLLTDTSSDAAHRTTQSEPAAPDSPRAGPPTERRLVSILFADLVGFTALAEDRDPEDIRELFDDYYDAARRVIARHGGVVDKFIGDAVMAVWGAPVARENDAERSVRAALELIPTVAAVTLDGEPLRIRAGLATGEAASTPGPEGRAVLAGDVVNTASRLQSVAKPGTALVDEATQRTTEHSIVYTDAGVRQFKGKSRTVHTWQPVRITAGIRGAPVGGSGMRAPLVGRDEPLRILKDAFHATVDESCAHRVTIVGVPGIGKTRLAVEFERYIDGLADDVLWHRGRSLAYGDGVAYSALSEMLRMRARITDDDAPADALTKFRATIERYAIDDDERKWLEPRLAPLLGLPGTAAPNRQELFAAWRRLVERLAAEAPTVLVFDELQWADEDLLDLIDYLLEWSTDSPMFVLTLARPELDAERPSSPGRDDITRVSLGPLPSEHMNELLGQLASGLPTQTRERILGDADGVPLYAVETLRMLLSRGALSRQGDTYALADQAHELRVPETLHALIAARIDALAPDERRLLQDAAVLGEAFSADHIAAVTAASNPSLPGTLAALVDKEFLVIDSDPMSPTVGHHTFVQGLVRKVAYETFSKRDRQQRHLDVAHCLERGADDSNATVEIIASHYLDAYQAVEDESITDDVRQALVRAAERAASLPAPDTAQRYYEQALTFTTDPAETAHLHEQAGHMAQRSAKLDAAQQHFDAAAVAFEGAARPREAARIAVDRGRVAALQGHDEDGVALLTEALDALDGERDEAFALVVGRLAGEELFTGRYEAATRHIEAALTAAESVDNPDLLAQTLRTKGQIYFTEGRAQEAVAIQRRALAIALNSDSTLQLLHSHHALSADLIQIDRYSEAIHHAQAALSMADALGDRIELLACLGNLLYPWYLTGRWDDIANTDPPGTGGAGPAADLSCFCRARVAAHRGDLEEASRLLAIIDAMRSSEVLEYRAYFAAAHALVLGAAGHHQEAIAEGTSALNAAAEWGADESVQEGLIAAAEAAITSDRWDILSQLLDQAEALTSGKATAYLGAHLTRFRAAEAAHRGDDHAAGTGFLTAASSLRDLGVPFALAVTLTDHAAWLVSRQHTSDARKLIDEARAIFERLQAAPSLGRLERIERRSGLTPAAH